MAFERRLLVEECNFVHFREVSGVHRANSLHASDVEQKDLFVGAYTNCKGAVRRHLDAMDITFVSLQVGEVLACLTVPNFDLFVNLASREKDQIVDWVEAYSAHDCLMTLKRHFEYLVLRHGLEIRAY